MHSVRGLVILVHDSLLVEGYESMCNPLLEVYESQDKNERGFHIYLLSTFYITRLEKQDPQGRFI